MIEKEIKKIKADYLKGMKYKDLFEKYQITLSDLKKIINKYKLTRDKSKILKGNQNAVGNKGGHCIKNNKNAIVTGEYEKIYKGVLTDNEWDIYKTYKIDKNDIKELLIKDYTNEYRMLLVREDRMMKRIEMLENKLLKRKEVINNSSNSDNGNKNELPEEEIIKVIQKIEDGLTRVQDTKRKSRENMIKLGFSQKTLELKEKQIDNESW